MTPEIILARTGIDVATVEQEMRHGTGFAWASLPPQKSITSFLNRVPARNGQT
jgi:hypothetical protein